MCVSPLIRASARTCTRACLAWSIRCTQIPYGMATPRYVRRARAAGLAVHVWTVNDPAVMADMLDIGVDGIMTDQTEALRELLISRGQWHPRPPG